MTELADRSEVAPASAITEVLAAARDLESRMSAKGDERADDAAGRLSASVIRPLAEAQARAYGQPETEPCPEAHPVAEPDGHEGEALWRLTLELTRLRVAHGAPTEIQEATAAMQDLALGFTSEDASVQERLSELESIQARLPSRIQSQGGGPYLVTNADKVVDWLGQDVPTRPQMALCRCGGSSSKPFCDGTHAEIGFKTEKDPKRVPDRRETYAGQQVTILDNRGTCQHAGYCSDRLATVFRVGEEPFVAPSGGRMDEIIRAVRDCPSGALSYAIDGREAREQVDHGGVREPAIEITKDGPYRITGAIPLVAEDGGDEPRNDGASREHYALCRCGHSQNKPFCSGMHWDVEFKDPVSDPDHEPTIFEWAGGLPALTRMTRLFYEKHVPQDPLLAPLFADMSPDHPERVAKWLAEVFCGPKQYSRDHGGYKHMVSQHMGKGLTEDQRARWVALILQSAQQAGLPADPEFRSVFSAYIDWGSRLALENSQPGAQPPQDMPMPHWDWNTAAGPPGSRVSALAPPPEDEEPVKLPAPDEDVGFTAHIKPLFRQRDRQSMKFTFDLWNYEDVKEHADAIAERVRNGSMPCDGAWPQEKVQIFERWIDSGMRE
jgi:CDGSH-type Zn-finger protein